MASLSKVKVSTIKNKEYHDLSCSYDGTSNFGAVFPSFARELMPKGKFSVSVGSKILNAPMPVPTMGEMYINHKHVFVPYVDVCPQYQSFLTAQPYTIPGGDSYVPTQLPKLDLPMLAQYILSYFADFTIYIKKGVLDDPTYDEKTEYEPFLFKRGYNQDDLDDAKDIFNAIWYPESGSNYFYGKSILASDNNNAKVDLVDFSDALNLMPLAPITRDGYVRSNTSICGQWLAGDFAFCGDREMSTSGAFWKYNGSTPIDGIDISTGGEWRPSQGYVDITTADVVSLFGPTSGLTSYAIAFRLRSTGKRLFSILLGLNYQFTPNLAGLVDDVNWLKLLAFYKSWFNIYRPKRQMSFTQTNCYKLIKLMELPDAESEIYSSPYVFADLVKEFIWDLALDPYYYLKQDYYGMSVLTPNEDYAEDVSSLPSHIEDVAPNASNDGVINFGNTANVGTASVSITEDFAYSPAVMKIAMGILKHVNKNTIIGKDIAAFIKAHFGISLDTSHDLDKVYLIGEVSENIDVSPVMSMAGTDTDELGAYAGRGYGESKEGNEFVFENNNDTHGVWITLTCVIPKSGYSQGIHRENRSLKRLDFPQSDFDALGYEVLARDEVSADYPVCTLRFNPHTYANFDRKTAFGFVPRQSAFKFGQNVVAGELALRSGKSQFSGYHLNRIIPYERTAYTSLYDAEGNVKVFSTINAPNYVPNVVHDEFRKIDPTDRLGNFNRVFYEESVNDDHFIVHFGFKVDAWLPLLSLSDSFDTYQDNTDSIKMVHS